MDTVTFCHYDENRRIVRVKVDLVDLESTKYYAISHVWGPIPSLAWNDVSELGLEVYASPHKIKFLTERLFELIGQEYFWMDILSVNQRIEDEKIAVVDHIPDIFRKAQKTIVVRDGDGLKKCCAEAVGEFSLWDGEVERRLLSHLRDKHITEIISESWLERVWTLQEAILSDNIQITSCDERENNTFDEYGAHISLRRLRDNLWSIARAWAMYEIEDGSDRPESTKFMSAFVNGGCVSREPIPQTRQRRRGLAEEFQHHSNSTRKTSKERDFILATLPQYGWYEKPKNVKEMSFEQIFIDCVKQAQDAGFQFIPKITKGMTEPVASASESQEPTANIPVPQCLGDFVKLFGSVCQERSKQSIGLQLGKVEVKPVPETISMNDTIRLVEDSMAFSKNRWHSAHRGELSGMGMLPEMDPVITGSNWYLDNKGETLEEYKNRLLREDLCNRMTPNFYEPECIKVLNAMWAGLHENDNAAKKDWHIFVKWLEQKDPPFYKETLIQLASMISCGLGISSLAWAKRTLRPFEVRVSEYRMLGLAPPWALQLNSPFFTGDYLNSYYCVQRVSKGLSLVPVKSPLLNLVSGRDIVLTAKLRADGTTQRVVGMLPDFLNYPDADGDFMDRFERLYSPPMSLLIHLE